MLRFDKTVGRFPLGVWIAIIALLLLFLAWGMQAYSLLNWDSAVDLGLQNDRLTGDAVERARAQTDWGVAAADMLWPLPIAIIALVGILRKRFYGFVAGLVEFSVGVYFPLVFAFGYWTLYRDTAIIALILWTIPSLLAIIGLWANRQSFQT